MREFEETPDEINDLWEPPPAAPPPPRLERFILTHPGDREFAGERGVGDDSGHQSETSPKHVFMPPPPGRKPPGEAGETPAARELWMREEIKLTVLGDALDKPDIPRVALFGKIDTAEIRDSFCVVISDEGKIEYRLTREVGTVEFSAALMRERLGLIAAWALGRLAADPESLLFNGIFQAAVWATTEAPRTEETLRTGTAGPMQVVTVDCDRVVTGDRARVTVDDEQQQDTARLSLARLIPGRPVLVRALARAVGDPPVAGARAAFEAAALAAAADMSPDAVLDAARTDSGPTGWLGLDAGRLTAQGVTAALIGTRTEVLRSSEVTMQTVAITGLWPQGPERPADRKSSWNGLDWYLSELDERHPRP